MQFERLVLGPDHRSLHSSTDGGSTENQRIEVSRPSSALSLHALSGQAKRWNVESDETTDLADQTRRCRTVRLAILPLSILLSLSLRTKSLVSLSLSLSRGGEKGQ